MGMRMFYLTSILILLQMIGTHSKGTTPIEDRLETEIEFKHPNSFKEYAFHTLSVRQLPFRDLYYNYSGVISSGSIGDWQSFASRYWYEIRTPAAMCPVPPVGIATQCDWALMVPCLYAADPFVSPRTIFVHTYMLPHFVESTLYFMDHSYRFVLVTGGSDMTIPRSLDPRYRPLRGFANSPEGGSFFGRILNDERVIHWFAENHDITHNKLSTLPTGLYFDGVNSVDDFADHPDRSEIISIEKRPLKFILPDRITTAVAPWTDIYNVAQMCEQNSTFCFRPRSLSDETGLPHADFLKILVSVPFVACVHGGGIDPSPKAWEAILVGTIPIIQHSALDDAYWRLPVMFVNDWSELFNNDTESLLLKWREKLAPYYEQGSALRKHALSKLKTSYWVEQFHHKYRTYEKALLELGNETVKNLENGHRRLTSQSLKMVNKNEKDGARRL